jgi:hypothetical protein
MFGNWPNTPNFGDDPVLGPIPVMWWGTEDRDGAADPWKLVPSGSIYLYMSTDTPKLYIKDAQNDADADWGTIDFTT